MCIRDRRGTQADDLVALTFGSEENAAKIIDVEAYKRVVGATENPSAIDTLSLIHI